MKEECNKVTKEMQGEQMAFQLANMTGVGSRSLLKLLEYAGGVEQILKLSEKEVREILSKKVADSFLLEREKQFKYTPAILKREKDIDFISYISSRFPKRLRKIPDPPFAIYVKGKLPEENVPAVAIIGARACSEYGKKVAGMFGQKLSAAGVNIISGMARGIDGVAQKGALEGNSGTYAVLGCGVDVCYPPENLDLYNKIVDKGGIISEYSPGTLAQNGFFPMRNRIISGLADLILVVEARKKSGTYITVTQALEQGKEVFAVPGRITDSLSDGCNYLLSQGAGIATGTEVILEALSYQSESFKSTEKNIFLKELNESQSCIIQELDITPKDIETIYQNIRKKCTISMEEMMLEMTKMQIAGLVEGNGAYYRLTCAL